jgi:hypothetical protein
MAWRPAYSLPVLRDQIQAAYWWAAPPKTPSVSWGMVSDAAHSSKSDHSPKLFPGWGSNIVTALDFPHRPDLRLDAGLIAEAIRESRDSRVKYVIFNRRIFSWYATPTRAAWRWGPYSNAANDPHTDHVHVSVVGDARADATSLWQIGAEMLTIEQEQMLRNLHDWMFDYCRGLVAADAGTPHLTKYVPNEILAELRARPAGAALTDAQIDALAERLAPRVAALLPAAPSAEAIADAVVDEIAS